MAAPRAREPAGLHLPLPPPGRAGEAVVLVIHTYIHGWGVSIDPTRTAYTKIQHPQALISFSHHVPGCEGQDLRFFELAQTPRAYDGGDNEKMGWFEVEKEKGVAHAARARAGADGAAVLVQARQAAAAAGGVKRKEKKKQRRQKPTNEEKRRNKGGAFLLSFWFGPGPQGVAAGGMGMHEAPTIEFVLVGTGRAPWGGGSITRFAPPGAAAGRPSQ